MMPNHARRKPFCGMEFSATANILDGPCFSLQGKQTRGNIGWQKRRVVRPRAPDEENPEWTKDDFARARPAAEVLPKFIINEILREKYPGGRSDAALRFLTSYPSYPRPPREYSSARPSMIQIPQPSSRDNSPSLIADPVTPDTPGNPPGSVISNWQRSDILIGRLQIGRLHNALWEIHAIAE
jgi:hypothetical protein